MNRLQVLAAANHLGQVPQTKPIRRHQLSGARRGQFAVDLLHPHRLVFRPDHNPMPKNPDGGIDVNAVTAIEIIEIIDYH
jgi:proteic killer suppression protein